MNKNRSPQTKNNRDILRYAGLAGQLLATIAIAFFLGIKADQWLHTMPLLSSVLPLLVLVGTFYKLTRETSGRGNDPKRGDRAEHTAGNAGNKNDNETK